ncbi:MAG: heavy-metal-associated domain-containing protein [Ramlibacter sp.]
MQKLRFDVHGMTCGGCTSSVRCVLGKIDGVSHVDVSLRSGTATLDVDTTRRLAR